MTGVERESILRDYSDGKLGTRQLLEMLDLRDFGDILIALGSRGLPLPPAKETPELLRHRERASELLRERLVRGV